MSKHNLLLKVIRFSIVGIFLFAIGCAFENPNRNQKDPIDEANLLADRGDYEGASKIIEDHLRSNPEDNKALMLLSNIYAAQVGINFQRLIPLLRHFLDESNGASHQTQKRPLVRLLKNSGNNTTNSAANALISYENTLNAVDAVLDVFEKVPDITAEQHPIFKKSLTAAFKVKHPSKGDALYRAVLLAIELKYSWLVENTIKFMEPTCTLNGQRLNQFLTSTRSSLNGVADQLTISYPKLAPELKSDMARFDSTIPKLQEQLRLVNFSAQPSSNTNGSFKGLWECL